MILPIHKKSGIFKKLKGKVIQTESETKETELPKLPKRKKLFSQFYDKIKKSGINSDSNMNDIKPIVNEFYKLLKSKNIEIPERLIYGDTQKIKEIFSVKPKINTEFRNAMDAILALFEYRELKKGIDYVGFGKPSKDEIPFKVMKREVKEINDKLGSGLSGGIGLSPSDTERFVLDLISKPKKPFFTALGTEYYPDLIIDADSLTKGKGFNPSFDFVLFRKPAKEVPDSKKKMIELKTKVETLIKSSTSNSDLIDKLDRVKGEIKGATPNIMFIDAKSLFRNEGAEASMMQPSESAMSMVSRYGITKYFIMGFYYKTDPPGRPQYTEGRNKNFVYSNIKDFINNILIRNATSDKFTALDVSSLENLKQLFEVPKQLDYDKAALDEETRRMFEERGEEIALEEKRDKLRKTLPVKLQELRNKIRDDQLRIGSTLSDIETLFRDANLGPDETTMELLTTAKHTYDQAVEMKRIAESRSEEEKRRIREEQERLESNEREKKSKVASLKAEEAKKRELKAQKRAKEKAEAEALKPKQKSYFEIQEELEAERAKTSKEDSETLQTFQLFLSKVKDMLFLSYKVNYNYYSGIIRTRYPELATTKSIPFNSDKLLTVDLMMRGLLMSSLKSLRNADVKPLNKNIEQIMNKMSEYNDLETSGLLRNIPEYDIDGFVQTITQAKTLLLYISYFNIHKSKKFDDIVDEIRTEIVNKFSEIENPDTELTPTTIGMILNKLGKSIFIKYNKYVVESRDYITVDDYTFVIQQLIDESKSLEENFKNVVDKLFSVENIKKYLVRDVEDETGFSTLKNTMTELLKKAQQSQVDTSSASAGPLTTMGQLDEALTPEQVQSIIASRKPTTTGGYKPKWALHKVYIKKPMSFEDAYELAHEYIKDKNKIFVKEYPNKFNFRNIPKTKFSKFRGKVINDDVTLIYGQLKPEYGHLEGSAKPPPFVGGEDMSGGQMKLREDFEYLRPLFAFQDKMSPEEFDHLLYINKPKPINKWFLGAGSGNEPETYYEQLVRRFRN